MLLSVCRINLCLLALLDTVETREDPFDILGRGRQAAVTIVDYRKSQTEAYFSKLWGHRSCILSAGIYLALDLICFHNTMTTVDIESQTERIHFVLYNLQRTHGDLNEGSKVLKRLLHIYHRWPARQVVQRQTIIDILALGASPSKDWVLDYSAPSTSTGTVFDFSDVNSTLLQQPPQQSYAAVILGSEFGSEFSTGLSGVSFDFLPSSQELDGEWPADAFTNTLNWQQML